MSYVMSCIKNNNSNIANMCNNIMKMKMTCNENIIIIMKKMSLKMCVAISMKI